MKILTDIKTIAPDAVTPTEYVAWLYGQTDANGMLVVPLWNDDGSVAEYFEKKNVQWNETDRDRIAAETETVINGIHAIAKLHDRLSVSEEENEKALSPELMQIRRMYLRPFDVSGFDAEHISDILRRKDILREIDDIRDRQLMGRYCAPFEYDFLEENSDVMVDADDESDFRAYEAALEAQARQRVGDGHDALGLVRHAQRLYTLIVNALSDVMIRTEEKRLIQSMVFHAFGKAN